MDYKEKCEILISENTQLKKEIHSLNNTIGKLTSQCNDMGEKIDSYVVRENLIHDYENALKSEIETAKQLQSDLREALHKVRKIYSDFSGNINDFLKNVK